MIIKSHSSVLFSTVSCSAAIEGAPAVFSPFVSQPSYNHCTPLTDSRSGAYTRRLDCFMRASADNQRSCADLGPAAGVNVFAELRGGRFTEPGHRHRSAQAHTNSARLPLRRPGWGIRPGLFTLRSSPRGHGPWRSVNHEILWFANPGCGPRRHGLRGDRRPGRIRAVAKTPADFDDFVYWTFSGLVPGTGESDEDGEPARWRSASFVAVSGLVACSMKREARHRTLPIRRRSASRSDRRPHAA